MIAKNSLTASASCVGGHVVNKKGTEPDMEIDSFLIGKSTTFSGGVLGGKVGVTIPETEEIFSTTSTKGIEGGVGTPGFDISTSSSSDTGYKIDYFSKNK